MRSCKVDIGRPFLSRVIRYKRYKRNLLGVYPIAQSCQVLSGVLSKLVRNVPIVNSLEMSPFQVVVAFGLRPEAEPVRA